MNRAELLEKARQIVTKDREDQYGSPENNLGLIAAFWRDYLGTVNIDDLGPEDVAAMMVLLKVARIATGSGTEDSWADIAGYAAIGSEAMALGPVEYKIGDVVVVGGNNINRRDVIGEIGTIKGIEDVGDGYKYLVLFDEKKYFGLRLWCEVTGYAEVDMP